jgi:hypothetical protein
MDEYLILDIIKIIATISVDSLVHGDVWYKLTLISDKFNKYSKTDIGIRAFIKAHYTCEVGSRHAYRKIFGVFHSFYDLPVQEMDNYRIWFYNGKIHREDDKPAVYADNEQYTSIKQEKLKYYKAWYKNGVRHRDSDKPAIMCEEAHLIASYFEFYDQGQLDDFRYEYEYESYYKNGLLHRDDDKPALIGKNGTMAWYKIGLLHRENGPACVNSAGVRRYYFNGVEQIGIHHDINH